MRAVFCGLLICKPVGAALRFLIGLKCEGTVMHSAGIRTVALLTFFRWYTLSARDEFVSPSMARYFNCLDVGSSKDSSAQGSGFKCPVTACTMEINGRKDASRLLVFVPLCVLSLGQATVLVQYFFW